MAAVIGDLIPGISRFHDIIVSPSSRQNQQILLRQQQQQQQHPHHRTPQRQSSYSQSQHSPHHRPSSRRRASGASTSSSDDIEDSKGDSRGSSGDAASLNFPASGKTRKVEAAAATATTSGVPLKLSSPPASSSSPPPPPPPPSVAGRVSVAEYAKGASMASQTEAVASAARHALHNDSSVMKNAGQQKQPSPSTGHSQSFQLPDSSLASSTLSGHVEPLSSTQQTSQQSQQNVIHVRDLAHMQSLADVKMLGATSNSSSLDSDIQTRYEISGMPIADVIEMVAALLTKITTTNDLQHDAMQRNVAHQQQANQPNDTVSPMSPLNHSVLAFHGKNVPAITILSYLSRIHKYCPTTYEVFLSLLVYFDRMTERVNEMVTRGDQVRSRLAPQSQPMSPDATHNDTAMRDNAAHASDESDSDLADEADDDQDNHDDEDNDDDDNDNDNKNEHGNDHGNEHDNEHGNDKDNDDDDDDDQMVDSPTAAAERDEKGHRVLSDMDGQAVGSNPATYFVVDSFNIHRLIISGVTCASKFFSDVFYTNSRYAKVGGLPLAELNHLEIQFLVLNDFRLSIPVEDLEAYATMLVEFYAREVMSQKSATDA
ncbi:hypothetical protein E4U21_004179 [Claviceps maximensis]|nr:hypothetical protein E4U21_004179 [Claviceps maximensis]